MTGIAIMHEDTPAQWLVTIGKKYISYMYVFKFKLMLGFYGNKHSGYVVNPMAPEYHLPFPTSLPYHLGIITCLFIQKLTMDRSASILLLHKIL